MPNLLNNQSSPYLQELSEQPVDWQPWGKTAFQLAKQTDKPVIVSIGYSSCHWCRQMSRENYEDSYVASIMNRHFVCIKVDREERPDLDLFYMEAARMFNQSAGWPLHAFCLPDGAPFWCGTYFPKEDNGQGIAPWPQVLMRIAEHFRKGRHELEENGKNALENLLHTNNSFLSDPREWKADILIQAGESLCQSHDDEWGGFTPAPKFPSPMKVDFLFSLGEAQTVRQNTGFSKKLDSCIKHTLGAMANGALFDHVNGGFFRYCLDREWKSPHFEKMLSDNALLVSTYSRSLRKFQNPRDQKIILKTLEWIEREMGSPDKGYASSLSAETNEMEGAHYLWTESELYEALGKAQGKQLEELWGTFAKSPDPLFLPRLVDKERLSFERQEEIFNELRMDRKKLTSPKRDEKRSCFQHALLARAYLDAGVALGDQICIRKAVDLLNWMENSFSQPDGSVSSLLYPNNKKSSWACLEDYTLWAEAVLNFASVCEGFGLGGNEIWIEKAETLISFAVEKFKDPALAGFYTTATQMKDSGPVSKKPWYDHATPTGNSSIMRCFHLLGILGEKRKKWNQEYSEALGAYPKLAQQTPDGIGHALCAITEATVGTLTFTAPKSIIQEVTLSMQKKPYRLIFLKKSEEIKLLNNQNMIQTPATSAQAIIDKIWL